MLSIGNNKLYIQNISNRYNHEIRNIMYANLRSIIAYRPINQMNDQFIQQNLHKYIQNDKFNNFMDIRFDPLFYNGPHIRKNRNDVQGYILYANKSLYITFRGSNDTDDLMACIDIRRKHLGNDIYKRVKVFINKDEARLSMYLGLFERKKEFRYI